MLEYSKTNTQTLQYLIESLTLVLRGDLSSSLEVTEAEALIK
jgi:hypothetical protein